MARVHLSDRQTGTHLLLSFGLFVAVELGVQSGSYSNETSLAQPTPYVEDEIARPAPVGIRLGGGTETKMPTPDPIIVQKEYSAVGVTCLKRSARPFHTRK